MHSKNFCHFTKIACQQGNISLAFVVDGNKKQCIGGFFDTWQYKKADLIVIKLAIARLLFDFVKWQKYRQFFGCCGKRQRVNRRHASHRIGGK